MGSEAPATVWICSEAPATEEVVEVPCCFNCCDEPAEKLVKDSGVEPSLGFEF